MPEAKRSSPSLLKAGVAGVVIFALMMFAVVAMNTGDLLWFWPKFDEIPVEIIVRCYGKDVEIKPGEPAFVAVTNAVNASLSGTKRWDGLSMSDATYQEYQTSPDVIVLKLHYDPPATIHSQYAYFKSTDWLLFPLDGRYASTNAVFGLEGEYIDPGSMHVNGTTPILSTLQEQGICTKR